MAAGKTCRHLYAMAVLVVCMVFSFSVIAMADNEISLDISKGAVTISENDDGSYSYKQSGTTVIGDDQVCISGTSNLTYYGTGDLIKVISGSVNMTIRDLTIRAASSAGAPLYVCSGAQLTLNLEGSNSLTKVEGNSTEGAVAVRVPAGAILTIKGTGSLTAEAGSFAVGIGAMKGDVEAGTINIEGGTITATGSSGAGVGGGYGCSGGTVTISGGTVTAISRSGAAIGGGCQGNGGVVNITGGTVNATSQIDAGIGSGDIATDSGIVNISGGIVTATGGSSGAGIGGGYEGNGANVVATIPA